MGYDRIVYIRYHFSCGLDRKDACWLSFTPLTGVANLYVAPNLGDFGFWILDLGDFGFWIWGFRILDFGFWGFWILDFGDFGFWGFWILDFGPLCSKSLCDAPNAPNLGDFGFWILGILGILDFGFWGFWILDFGVWGFWILDFVTNFGCYIRKEDCARRTGSADFQSHPHRFSPGQTWRDGSWRSWSVVSLFQFSNTFVWISCQWAVWTLVLHTD